MVTIRKNNRSKSEIMHGLCTTCNNTGFCSFRASDADRLIWYCELFDCFVEVEEVLETAKAILASTPLKKRNNKFSGLCMNCAGNKSCTFPKPEGGIWHCEEYK